MNFVRSAVGIDNTHAIAVIATSSQVAFADAFKEFCLFAFETVRRSTTMRHALAACFDCQVEHYRQFREATAAREFCEALHFVCPKPTGVTLVGKRAPRKTVGNDNLSGVQRGLDDFVNHLSAGSIVQQKLGIVCHDALECRVQQKLANAFGDFCTARFTQPYDLVAFGFKSTNKQVNVR